MLMAEAGCIVRFKCAPSWEGRCGSPTLVAGCSTTRWANLFCKTNPSDFPDPWGKRLNKRTFRVWCDSGLNESKQAENELATQGSLLRRCIEGSEQPVHELHRYCEEGRLDKALNALFLLKQPSAVVYTSLLKACGRRKALAQAKRVHARLEQDGLLETNRLLCDQLISTLVKCGGLNNALEVFYRLPHRSAFSLAALISGYTVAGQGQDALRMFNWMQEEGLKPNKLTLVSLLKVCGSMLDLEEGKRIHTEALKHGFATDLFIGTCLVDMYAKCGSIVDAQTVFDGLPQRDVVSWTAMLTAHVQQGHAEMVLRLYRQMQEEDVSPNDRTLVTVLQACGMLAEKEDDLLVGKQVVRAQSLLKGKAIHGYGRSKGYLSDVFVCNTLLSMYGKCGAIADAEGLFEGLHQRNVVSWTAMLAAYAHLCQPEKALQLYEEMREENVVPDVRTYVSALQACCMLAEKEEGFFLDGRGTKLKSLSRGKVIHADAWSNGHRLDIFLGSSLITVYEKCGSFVDAQRVFDGLSQRDLVAWTAMLAAYIDQGQADTAFQLYEQMLEQGMSLDDRTYVSTLQACGLVAEREEEAVVDGQLIRPKSLECGKAVHADAQKKGYASDGFVANTLVSMYGKCGSIADAESVFNGLSGHDVVSWNAMLSAYIEQGHADKALQLYTRLQHQNMSPDEVTVVCMLQACSSTGNLDICREVHHSLISKRDDPSCLLASSLIHAYGRCSSMVDAQAVFDALPLPSVVSWNALIAGYARQGTTQASLQLYDKMCFAKVKPDGVTFLSLLSACGHAGLVDRGVGYFESMAQDHGIAPEIEHYASIVDLLGRAGYFAKVEELLSLIPVQPDLAMWLCLLGACRKHRKVVLAQQVFASATRLQPNHAAAYILMSNIYADAGLWEDVENVHALERSAGAWKTPGLCWIQNEEKSHRFVVVDRRHPKQEEVYDLIEKVNLELMGKQDFGYYFLE